MLEKIDKMLLKEYQEHVTGDVFELYETSPHASCKVAKFQKKGGEVIVYKFDKTVKVTVKHRKKKDTVVTKDIECPFPFFQI